MSKILGKGETGFGILIESDSGYMTSDLNPMIISEGFKIKPNEPVLINCILQKWGVKNKNGRIYPKDVLVPQVAQYMSLVDTNSAVSEADHADCVYASESKICTKDGWKLFEDIADDEEILTLNVETNQIEIQRIEKKIFMPYHGEMYNFISNNIELTVTGNHRFLIENSNTKKRQYVFAKDIYENKDNIFSCGKNRLLKTGEWFGSYDEYFTLGGVDRNYLGLRIKHELINKYIQPINIKSEDWFAFMGIYLADGHSAGTVSKIEKSKGFDVVITQKKSHTKILIKELLDRLPFDYWVDEHEDGKCQYHIADARLYQYLYTLGNSHEKHIPVELKQASSDLLKIMFDWFALGDGRNINYVERNGKANNRKSVFSTSLRLIEDLKEISLKFGVSGNITEHIQKDSNIITKKTIKKELVLSNGDIEMVDEEISTSRLIKAENCKLLYTLNYSKSKNIYLDKRMIKIKKIDFNDNIACVRVKNGNFCVMVNGKSHWTGNSSVISLQNLSHLITKMWWGTGEQENILFGELRLIVSPGFINYGVCSVIGDKIVLYLQHKIKLGISSRGVGTLKEIRGENIVQNDYELVGFDLVSTPSTPGAFLFPKTELNFGENYISTNSGILLKEDANKLITGLDNFLLL